MIWRTCWFNPFDSEWWDKHWVRSNDPSVISVLVHKQVFSINYVCKLVKLTCSWCQLNLSSSSNTTQLLDSILICLWSFQTQTSNRWHRRQCMINCFPYPVHICLFPLLPIWSCLTHATCSCSDCTAAGSIKLDTETSRHNTHRWVICLTHHKRTPGQETQNQLFLI